ncbi:MAG: MerR family transcriptional regulator [Myxococcota bacterium]
MAGLARISVRALHHYDALGLLRPSGRTQAGYRLYTDADLERLQQVLFHRELGFPLEEIRRILSDTNFDRRAALALQRQQLVTKRDRLQAMLDLVDATIDRIDQGKTMSAKEIFGDFRPADHEDEVRERWGETEAYAESARRTKRYGESEQRQIRAEMEAIERDFVTLMEAGVSPDDARAGAVAERHRQHIERWFYPCAPAMHRGLGDLYLADARFAKHYDDRKAGLAQYVRDAIHARGDAPDEPAAGPTG